MPTYKFKAMDLAGATASGEVEAISPQDVVAQLKQRGLVVVDVVSKYNSRELNIDLFPHVKADELAVATRQLSTMVNAGMPILRALSVLEQQSSNKLLKTSLSAVRDDVEGGGNLSDAMAKHPKVFNDLYVSMVRAGEAGGLLESVLMRVADQVEKDAALRRQVRAAMAYPTLVITFAVGIMLALVAFLIPVFIGVFKDFPGNKLPALSQFMVDFSHALTHQWYLILLIVGGLAGGFIAFRRSDWGKPYWDQAKLKFPMKIGEVVQKVAIARWSRTLSSLVSAGVPMIQALEITGRTGGNIVVERAMNQVISSVKQGGTISAPLKQSPVFPPMVPQMIAVGEETGALDTMLSKVADFYDDQVDAAIKALTSILEPVMIIVVGAIVGVIVISMYLPLFDVYKAIP
jgi:type IV pilus assembly protein PilC